MSYPKWVPPTIVQCLNEYRNGNQAQAPDDAPSQLAEIWHRLATRPEMEAVWHFIAQFDNDNYFPLVANGGLFGNINRRLRAYHAAPKLSPTDYHDEMTEIARMAAALSAKLKKFSATDLGYYNPFPPHALLDKAANAVGYDLPPIDAQLIALANTAKAEAVDQFRRFPLPRKVNDKNALRTYFIRIVSDFFFVTYSDFAPSRLAIFCSVALDDPDITPDLIRKLCPIDAAERTMLRQWTAHH